MAHGCHRRACGLLARPGHRVHFLGDLLEQGVVVLAFLVQVEVSAAVQETEVAPGVQTVEHGLELVRRAVQIECLK